MIIDKNIEDTLKQIPSTVYGMALTKYLEQYKGELNNVETIKTNEELLGRQFALKLIKDLFKFMGEKKVETPNKNQYV